MPLPFPTGAILLDVTLRREAWSGAGPFTLGTCRTTGCRLLDTNAETVAACFSDADVTARLVELKTQIEAASADGWT